MSEWTRGRIGYVGFLFALIGFGTVAFDVPQLSWPVTTGTLNWCEDVHTDKYMLTTTSRCTVTWTVQGDDRSAAVDFPVDSVHNGDTRPIAVHVHGDAGYEAVYPDGLRGALILYGAMGTGGLAVLVGTFVSWWRERVRSRSAPTGGWYG